MKKVVLLTGVGGQDGSYLAEFLLSIGYEVHGIVRRQSQMSRHRIDHLQGKITLHYGDLTDPGSLFSILWKVEPDEVYNLAAQSHVGISFEIPGYTHQVNALGVISLLEAIRVLRKPCRFYQASSSEQFGQAKEFPQSEQTPHNPVSPYAISKESAYLTCKQYREGYGMFICNGILFNHTSPRRGENFVSRKITQAVARIKAGKQSTIALGNLDARRDWGYAHEYVEAMWLMLQQDKPDDYVIATGESHSVGEFAEKAFANAGLDWREYVTQDPSYFRPIEVHQLIGDSTKAFKKLGWRSRTSFNDLVAFMVDEEMRQVIR